MTKKITDLTALTPVDDTDVVAVVDVSASTTKKAVVSDLVRSGAVVQYVGSQSGAVATGTTIIPADDTIPQNTEGDQYLSLAITPKNTTNKLVIEVTLFISSSAASTDIVAALFQDATVAALAADATFQATATGRNILKFSYDMNAGTTSSTTFKVRAGPASAATLTLNGLSGGRLFGGVAVSAIRIWEVKA